MVRALRLFACLLLLGSLSACSGRQKLAGEEIGGWKEQAPGVPAASLPDPASLPPGQSGRRRVSTTTFDLLVQAPVLEASAGSSWTSGDLTLDSTAAGGLAWAVFALPGLPFDHSIYPTKVAVDKDAAGWVALANYARGRWDITRLFGSGELAIQDGADYLSPNGCFYAALLAYPDSVNPDGRFNAFAFLATCNLDLPEHPIAQVELVSNQLQSTLPIEFSHAGSLPGDGVFTDFTYDFGDGSAPLSVSSLTVPVIHVFEMPGDYQVSLSVTAQVNGANFSDSAGLSLKVILVGPPVAKLNIAGSSFTSKYPISFDALGSDPGQGVFTQFSYDFGDGSPLVFTGDPAEVVQHTYASGNAYTIVLTASTDQGGVPRSDTDASAIQVVPAVSEMLLVCNSDMPESLALAQYYAAPDTGRGIDPARLIGLPLGSGEPQLVSRSFYETQIRDPLKQFITGQALTASLKYILLFKGVPHRINGTNDEFADDSDYSSVDSELCTLFSDGSYPLTCWLWNESEYYSFESPGGSFYLGVNAKPLGRAYSFKHGDYQVTDPAGNAYPLDYLVGRLSAYTWAEAEATIDRSKAADKSGAGWAILDSSDQVYLEGYPFDQFDTMVDPVWPFLSDTPLSGYEYLTGAGYSAFVDDTVTLLTRTSGNLPAGAADAVMCYCGWGIHAGHTPTYILDDLDFTYLPGAACLAYESFNGTDFDSTDGIARRGQGQVCDFLRMGATVGIGNAWEPFTHGQGDERAIFYRYEVAGDPWIEAAYKGLRLLSWQEVVVGDPLCRIR